MRGTLPRIDKYDKYVMPAECDVGESWPYQHYDQVRSMEEFKNSLEIGCPVCIWLFQDAQFDLTQESLELQHVELWPGMSCCNVYLRFSNYWGRCKIYSNKGKWQRVKKSKLLILNSYG